VISVNYEIRSHEKFNKNPSVMSHLTFDDNLVLVNGDTGKSLVLNKSGKVIWNLLDGKLTQEEIVAQVCKEFKNVPDSVAQDVNSVILTLSAEGFIDTL